LPEKLPQVLTWEVDMESVGQKLARFRKESDLKQATLAKLIGASYTTISRIENDVRPPTAASLGKLLLVFKSYLKWNEDEYRAIYTECFQQLGISSTLKSAPPRTVEPDTGSSINLDNYVGKYYLYGFISSGENRITYHELNITRVLDKLIANMKGTQRGNEFKGELMVMGQNIFISLDQLTTRPGKLLYVFYNTPSRFINKLWGIVAGTSVIDEPMAKVVLLSKELLDDETSRNEFKSNGYDYQNSIWKILKDVKLFTDNRD
jgi:transcriptional regulator with XRE-family HTH domain